MTDLAENISSKQNSLIQVANYPLCAERIESVRLERVVSNALAMRMWRCRLISAVSAIHLPSSQPPSRRAEGAADPPLEVRDASAAQT